MIYNILTVFILNLSDFKRVGTVSVAKVLNKAIKILILGVLCIMIHIYNARIKAVYDQDLFFRFSHAVMFFLLWFYLNHPSPEGGANVPLGRWPLCQEPIKRKEEAINWLCS